MASRSKLLSKLLLRTLIRFTEISFWSESFDILVVRDMSHVWTRARYPSVVYYFDIDEKQSIIRSCVTVISKRYHLYFSFFLGLSRCRRSLILYHHIIFCLLPVNLVSCRRVDLLKIISLHPRLPFVIVKWFLLFPTPSELSSPVASLSLSSLTVSPFWSVHRGERTTSSTTWSSEEIRLLHFQRRRDFFQFPHPSRYP